MVITRKATKCFASQKPWTENLCHLQKNAQKGKAKNVSTAKNTGKTFATFIV